LLYPLDPAVHPYLDQMRVMDLYLQAPRRKMERFKRMKEMILLISVYPLGEVF
jgi:hypothetical protein